MLCGQFNHSCYFLAYLLTDKLHDSGMTGKSFHLESNALALLGVTTLFKLILVSLLV